MVLFGKRLAEARIWHKPNMETLQRTANRGSISTGFDVDNSVKLEVDNNEWLYRDAPTAGNRKTFTLSLWLKRAVLGHTPAGGDEYLAGQGSNARYHFAGDTIRFQFESGSTELESSRVYRDPSAWYHFVLAVDTSQGTAANRVKLYVNGVQEAWNNTEYPSLNQESDWMNTNDLYIGTKWASNSTGDGDNDLSGYLSEVVLLDGTAASPTSFGEFDSDSGIWKPIDVSGLTFGSQGFYLNFATAGDLGDDKSGNGNDLTENNLAAADQATDTPTNNFCTLNAVFVGSQSAAPSDGATYMSDDGTNQTVSYAGTMGVTKGKWYYETYINSRSSSYGLTIYVGYHTFKDNYSANAYTSSTNQDSVALYGMHTGQYWTWNGGSRSVTSGLGSIGASGVGKYVGIALNLDDNQITFYYDGSAITNGSNLALNNLGTDTDAGIFAIPAIGNYDNNHTVNFGGYTGAPISSAQSDANGYGTFEHAPPSGYYALCTQNLAEFG